MSDSLSALFAALADPTRRAMLARLRTGPASATVLAEPFRITQPAISKHLKVLERTGLIARAREGQWRPCRLEPARLREVGEWLQPYRALWEQGGKKRAAAKFAKVAAARPAKAERKLARK